MTHIRIDRMALPERPASGSNPPHRRSGALLASCAFAVAALALSSISANAGCNSGNIPDTDGITSSGC
jgi:hypothetical protein